MPIGNAYIRRMPVGFLGAVNRSGAVVLQAEVLDPVNGPTLYGTVVKMTAGKILKLAGSETTADFVGIIARPFPVQEMTAAGSGLGDPGTPNLALHGDILKQGYICVRFAGVAAVKGGQVHVVVLVAGGAIGDLVAVSTVNTVPLTNGFFMGSASVGEVVEISYNVER